MSGASSFIEIDYLPECLSELEGFVDDAFSLLVIAHFGVALERLEHLIQRQKKSHTVSGKSFLRG